MGTTYSITIDNLTHNKEEFKLLIDKELHALNLIFSTYIDNSEISIINNSKAELIKISSSFKEVLNKALYYSKLSKGSYDITIGPLIDLWGFNSTNTTSIPSIDNIKGVLENIGYNKISVNNNFLFKENKNIKLDLNSIAKGYAVDKISEFIEKNNYFNYLVEIGGELKSKNISNSNDWVIGIQHPSDNNTINKINLNNLSMATSGSYNNYFESNGKIFSHILNPKTGYPYEYKTLSATIVSEYCIDADAYATLAMTMNPNDVISLINKINNTEAYILEVNNNEIIEYKSNGFNYLIVSD